MHIAIIMDGNGRWAARRGLPRNAGHREGAKAVNVVVEAAARNAIDTLSLYAFSSDNWNRPPGEVHALFTLLRHYLLSQTRRCLEQSIQISIIGRRDRLDPKLLQVIQHSERATAHCTGMQLRIAIDYSSQHSVIEAARSIQSQASADPVIFLAHLAAVDHSARPALSVDLLIRTGGEKRLSDFLLFECAYAELYFTDCFWPDFDAGAFNEALQEFARRDRRFGRLASPALEAATHG
jgi:undecaprenyl diphosphate synthase